MIGHRTTAHSLAFFLGFTYSISAKCTVLIEHAKLVSITFRLEEAGGSDNCGSVVAVAVSHASEFIFHEAEAIPVALLPLEEVVESVEVSREVGMVRGVRRTVQLGRHVRHQSPRVAGVAVEFHLPKDGIGIGRQNGEGRDVGDVERRPQRVVVPFEESQLAEVHNNAAQIKGTVQMSASFGVTDERHGLAQDCRRVEVEACDASSEQFGRANANDPKSLSNILGKFAEGRLKWKGGRKEQK